MVIKREGDNMTEMKIEENDPIRIVGKHHMIRVVQYCRDSDTKEVEKVVQ